MTTIYIGTSSNYISDTGLWKKHPHIKEACAMIKYISSAKSVTFVCNSLGEIYDGDVYAVTLHEDDCEIFYLLRTGFAAIDNSVAEKYINDQNNKYPKRIDINSKWCYAAVRE